MNKISNHALAALPDRSVNLQECPIAARGVQSECRSIILADPRRRQPAWTLLALFPLLSLTALGAQQGDFGYYDNGSGGAVVGAYVGPGGAAVIPGSLGGLPVVAIAADAFRRDPSLSSVTIPDSVVDIGGYGYLGDPFGGCTNLTAIIVGALNPAYSSVDGVLFNKAQTVLLSCPAGKAGDYVIPNSVTNVVSQAFVVNRRLRSVTIPNSVTDLGNYTFDSCTGLTNVTIGNSVRFIGGFAFDGCSGLTRVVIPISVRFIGGEAFTRCTSLTSVTIGNGVTNIGYLAFEGCTSLTNLTIPNSVKSIGNAAFANCVSLTSVTLPNSLTYMDSGVFQGCASLTSVVIPSSLTTVAFATFTDCTALTNVTIPSSVTLIRGFAFSRSGLTSVTIPDSVTSIEGGAFAGCNALPAIQVGALNPAYSSVGGVLFNKTGTVLLAYPGGKAATYAIANNVTSIGNYAFYGCTGLTNLTIPDSVIDFGFTAFCGCTGLTSITIPNSVTDIGDEVFFGCTGLTNVVLPNSVTSIASGAFMGCNGLTSLAFIPNSVTSIGAAAFSSCSGLANITFPNSVTTINDSAFASCTNLTSITIPDSVTSIRNGAFIDCTALKNVVIPDSVIFLDESVFEGCTGLTNVTIGNGVTMLRDWVFNVCTGLTSVTLPNSMTVVGFEAFGNCSGLTNVIIPNSVTNIGEVAFWYCTGLTSLTIPNSVTTIGENAFGYCSGLISVYFEGDVPGGYTGSALFDGSPFVTVFRRAGATGWGSTFAERPVALWVERPSYADWAVSTGLNAQFPAANGEGDDADGDGLTNGAEWFAGTDPVQSASRLELERAPRPSDLTASDKTPVPAGQRAVYFRSVPGRYYGVQSTTNLGGAWTLQAVRIASAAQTRFVLPSDGLQIFYRVLALP